MKKIYFLAMVLTLVFSLTSCLKINKTEKIGDFIYKHCYGENDFTNSKEYYSVIGLTEEGKEKTELIVPSNINDIPVVSIGQKNGKNNRLKSEKLENLYLTEVLFFPEKDVFKECPNLQKVICLSKNWDEEVKMYGEKAYNQYRIINNTKQYFNIYFYLDLQKNDYWNRKNLYRPGNVVYFLNEQEDIYYIDFCENITSDDLPKDPKRDGYKFMGWYKEKECINKWDIERDLLPVINIWSDFMRYDMIKLYPKWEINV